MVLLARGCPTVCVTRVWAGVDKVWGQEKSEARKMLENAAESHTSGVSMKEQSTDCSRARFWIRYECSVNGNAYPGTLRKGPVETCMGSSGLEWNKPAQVSD